MEQFQLHESEGKEIKTDTKKCPECNKLNRDIAKYCRFCGAEIAEEETSFESVEEEKVEVVNPTSTEEKEATSEKTETSKPSIKTGYIGLTDIAEKLNRYIELLKIEKEQKKLGIRLDKSTTVIIFRGETGTGKSLVANEFITDLKKSKVLSSSRIERTTLKIFQKSYGDEISISQYLEENKPGILLVDEIHGDERYLHELLLGLTRTPSDTVCILLGLKKPLDDYFSSNQDDVQRVSSFYDFPNPSDEDLGNILIQKINLIGFEVSQEVKDNLPLCIQEARHDESCIYKNGWLVEKEILKKIRAKQAERLQKNFENLKREDYIKIILEDLPIKNKQMTVDEILAQMDSLIGMENVKAEIRELANTIEMAEEKEAQGVSSKKPSIHIVFTGNPGTGKTTVARLLGKLFYSMKLLPSDKVVEVDRSKLVGQYVGETAKIVSTMCDKAIGGILFIDEAYSLAGNGVNTDSYGQEAIDTLLKRMEDDRGKFVVIAAGYRDQMQRFITANPGLKSRFTHYIHIEDYSSEQLSQIFDMYAKNESYQVTPEAKECIDSCIKDMWRSKGKDFANGRTVRQFFDEIIRKMSTRLSKIPKEQRTKEIVTTITKEDVPNSNAEKLSKEEILAQLDSLIGMQKVKKTVKDLCETLNMNKKKEGFGIEIQKPAIHIVFTGNPGTGKTTVARILSKLFYSMGLLPTDKLIEVDKSGLVGQYVGETPKLVNNVIDSAMGGVLFIDEAYTLVGTNGTKDTFGQEAIDTLLKRMEDDRGKFIVIAAGYQNQMRGFIEANPGLKSRFTEFIHLEDYSPDELYQLFLSFAKQGSYTIADDAKSDIQSAIKYIYDNRGKDFANGRTMREFFNQVVRKLNSRLALLPESSLSKEILTTITKEDIPVEERESCGVNEVLSQLDELIGMKDVKTTIRELCQTIEMNKEREAKVGIKEDAPAIHIVFTGNPGTGKTTVARILSKLFYSMGLLPTDKLVETDRGGLVAQYIGQTAPLVNSVIDSAMGGVLFIDEAYTLAGGGEKDFGQEAIDTLLKRMEDDRGKFIVIAAGYQREMQGFIESNPGLKSRFTQFIHLEDYSPDELYQLFCLYAKKASYTIADDAKDNIISSIKDIYDNRGKDFANGRTIRNFFNEVKIRMNSRIALLTPEERTPKVLTTITKEDI